MEPRKLTRPSLCPSCGAPGYTDYVLEAPVERGGGRYVRVTYSFRCDVCGYSDAGELLVPLDGLYRMRYLLTPEAAAYVERAMTLAHVYEITKATSSSRR